MAQVTNDNGRMRVLVKVDGKRRSVPVGHIGEDAARAIAKRLQHLAIMAKNCTPQLVHDDVTKWLSDLTKKNTELYDRIAEIGLASKRPEVEAGEAEAAKPKTYTVEDLTRDVLAAHAHAKPTTLRNYRQYAERLKGYFGAGRDVATIKNIDAAGFIAHLRAEGKKIGKGEEKKVGLGKATVARSIKAYRMFFRYAVDWEKITRNPFVGSGIKAGDSSNRKRMRYIPLDLFNKVLACCNDPEFRAVLTLSRIGGLRCPSEVLALKWADVVWPDAERGIVGKLIVNASKTEHTESGGVRELPLFPELAEALQALLGAVTLAGTQGEYIISDRKQTSIWRKRLTNLIRKAGLTPWPKVWQNMRASRESELYRQFPLDTVCKWTGHTPEVAAKYYLMDSSADENFKKASGIVAQAVEKSGAPFGARKQEKPSNAVKLATGKNAKTPENSTFSGVSHWFPIPPAGFAPASQP